jgi:hypothetical protein
VEIDKFVVGLAWRVLTSSVLRSIETVAVIIIVTIECTLWSVWRFDSMMLDSIDNCKIVLRKRCAEMVEDALGKKKD